MPSSHTQLAFFNSMMSVLVLWRRRRHEEISENREMMHAADVLSSVLSILTIPLAFVVAYSRVELGYHTIEQVIAGAMIGLMFGSMWFLVTTRVFAKQFSELVKEEDECTGNAPGRNNAKRKRRKFGKFLRETLNMRDSSLCCEPFGDFQERGWRWKISHFDERCRWFVK